MFTFSTKVSVCFDRWGAESSRTEPSSLKNKEKSPGVESIHHSSEYAKILKEVQEKSFSPEVSREKTDHILALIERLDLDDTLRDIMKAVNHDQLVPREVTSKFLQVLKDEKDIWKDITKDIYQLTQDDQKRIIEAMFGSERDMLTMFENLKKTVVVLPDGRKITGDKVGTMLPKEVINFTGY